MLHRLICAASRWGEPSRKVGSAAAIFAARPQSSVRVSRNSSLIVSTLIGFSIVLRPRQSRPSDRGQGDEGGGCIACDRNEEEECLNTCSHAADLPARSRGFASAEAGERRQKGRKKDAGGAAGMEK
jgi:hypothetical protein